MQSCVKALTKPWEITYWTPSFLDLSADSSGKGFHTLYPKCPRHKETWWWNEEVAEAVRNKEIKYGKWKKENTEKARMEYKKSRQNAELSLQQRKRNRRNGQTT